MDKTSLFFELSKRANINSFVFKGKRIFIYNDHRTILNIIFFALKNDIIEKAPNVISFDYHDDALDPQKSILEKASSFNLRDITIEEFNSIIEFELSSKNDDWVKTGMEFNIINNAVSIGAEIDNNSNISYNDSTLRKHEIISMTHLSSSLASRGELGDSELRDPYSKKLKEIFSYNIEKRDDFGKMTDSFILDFDLDCFSGRLREKQIAWPEKMFIDEMRTKCGYYDSITPLEFINELINRCEFITIAMEPGCCGGYGESFKILSFLDKYIFHGTLQTS
jgi:hypothetical protein